jgi:hypothetical protein
MPRLCGSPFKVLRKNISETAFKLAKNLLKSSQRDALGALLKTVQRGRRQSQFTRKLGVSLYSPAFFQKAGKLIFQRIRHVVDSGKKIIPDAE